MMIFCQQCFISTVTWLTSSFIAIHPKILILQPFIQMHIYEWQREEKVISVYPLLIVMWCFKLQTNYHNASHLTLSIWESWKFDVNEMDEWRCWETVIEKDFFRENNFMHDEPFYFCEIGTVWECNSVTQKHFIPYF